MKKTLCIGRGYIGKALSKYEGFTTISHQDFVENPDQINAYNIVVNTAAITGDRKCKEAGYDAVIDANVKFALSMQAEVLKRKKNFIQLSTVGIVETQVAPSLSLHDTEPPFYVHEHTFVYPHNLYCASKILNETAIGKRKHLILRLPWVLVEGVFQSRIQHWDSIQDTWCSVLTIETLVKVIQNHSFLIGTYQIANAHVYFPHFISEQLGKELPIRKSYPTDMTAAVPVSTEKASEILKTLGINLKSKSKAQIRFEQF